MNSIGKKPTLRVAIAGGGLLGRLSAWRLLREGVDVSLFEAGSLSRCPGAARTAAAMISPLSEVVDSERLIYDMGIRGLSLWPLWNQQLSKPIHYCASGSLVVAHSQDASQLHQFAEKLRHHLSPDEKDQTRAQDHKRESSTQDWQWLDSQQLKDIEPELSHFHRALHLKPEAYLDNHALLDQLLVEIERLGGIAQQYSEVENLTSGHLSIDGKDHSFDCVIDCRGLGAKDAIKDLRGVRGEVLWVKTKEVQLQRPIRFMHPKYKLYVVPKPDHQYIIGATEIESEDLSPMSLRSNLELSSALYSLHPAFSEARITATDVNLRPALMDHRPRLCAEPGLIRANGLYRHGYLLAPVVVENIVAKVLERSPAAFASELTPPNQTPTV